MYFRIEEGALHVGGPSKDEYGRPYFRVGLVLKEGEAGEWLLAFPSGHQDGQDVAEVEFIPFQRVRERMGDL